MQPLTVFFIIFAVVIILTAIFLRIPNLSKDGGNESRFNVMRIILVVGVIVVGIIYSLVKKG